MSLVYLLLGANLGDRFLQMSKAFDEISLQVGAVTNRSSLYQTAAWGVEEEPPYLNQVVELQTTLSPQELLKTINGIEDKLGRTRKLKWESRVIDIDILFYDDEIINDPNLIVPHPYLHKRKFVLVPLAEITSGLVHPVLNKNVQQLLSELDDPLEVKKVDDFAK